ncbi:MAG: signal peptidase II [Candidatus Kuenenbacteria bacterium]
MNILENKSRTFQRNKWLLIFLTLAFFATDRLFKYLFMENILNERCFFITLIKNEGAAFGLKLPGSLGWIFYILIVLIIFFLTMRLAKLWREKRTSKIFPLLLIIAGAISNLIDRLKFGGVIDFIDLKIWPVFNLADIMIVAGILYLLFSCSCKKKLGCKIGDNDII